MSAKRPRPACTVLSLDYYRRERLRAQAARENECFGRWGCNVWRCDCCESARDCCEFSSSRRST